MKNGQNDFALMIVAAILLLGMTAACIYLFVPSEKLPAPTASEPAQAVLEQGIRGESPEEKSIADRAEAMPDAKVTGGQWVYRVADDTGANELTARLVLGDDRQFHAEVTAKEGGVVKTHKAAAGAWFVKGSTLVFIVRQGALDIFPFGGRLPVVKATPQMLVVWSDGAEHAFVRMDK